MVFHTLDELSPDFNSWLLVKKKKKKKLEYVRKVAVVSKAGWRARSLYVYWPWFDLYVRMGILAAISDLALE